jgi:hypothetical protein
MTGPTSKATARDLAAPVGGYPAASAEAPGAPTPSAPTPGAPTVIAGAGVADFVARHGGKLYVWTVERRCCSGGLTLLETDVVPRSRRHVGVEPFDGGGFELYLDGGPHGLPHSLVLELRARGRTVRAYWNDRAFIF